MSPPAGSISMTDASMTSREAAAAGTALADRKAAVRALPLFASMPDSFLEQLAAACESMVVPQGTVLFHQGEKGNEAEIVVSGEAEVLAESPLGSSRIAMVGPGHFLGEMGALADVPRTATVIATTEMSLLRIRQADLHHLIGSYPEASLPIIRELARRLDNVSRPLGYLLQAANALEQADIDPALLDALAEQADAVTPFAQAFARVVRALVARRDSQREMALSARLQRSILPPAMPVFAGAEIGAVMEPAKAVGGDFYDVFALDDRRIAVTVADVSGKGMPAAFFMAVSRTALRALATSATDTADSLLSRLNARIAAENSEVMFVTVFLGLFDRTDGRFEWCSAGHTDAIAIRGDDLVRLRPTGPAIGIDEDARYTAGMIELSPGDSVVMYTDGITEAMSPTDELFGEEAVMALLRQHGDRAPQALVDALVTAVTDFAAGRSQADDITCLALRRT